MATQEHQAHPTTLYHLQFDGAARGNPGPGGAGAILMESGSRKEVGRVCKPLGHATSNVAEYKALIAGMQAALSIGVKKLRVEGDSKLVVSQVKGVWKIGKPHLKPLAEEAKALMRQFDSVTLTHIPRELNAVADALSNEALDMGGWEGLMTPEGDLVAPLSSTNNARGGPSKSQGTLAATLGSRQGIPKVQQGLPSGTRGPASLAEPSQIPAQQLWQEAALQPVGSGKTQAKQKASCSKRGAALIKEKAASLKAEAARLKEEAGKLEGAARLREEVARHRERAAALSSRAESGDIGPSREEGAALAELKERVARLREEAALSSGAAMLVKREEAEAEVAPSSGAAVLVKRDAAEVDTENGEEAAAAKPRKKRRLAEGGVDPKAKPDAWYQLHIRATASAGVSSMGGVLVEEGSEKEVGRLSTVLPDAKSTSHTAAYRAVILGMQEALEVHVRKMRVHCNSQLLTEQMNGLCEVRDKVLKGLWVAANKLRAQFEECTIEHVDKKDNEVASELAKVAQRGGGWQGLSRDQVE